MTHISEVVKEEAEKRQLRRIRQSIYLYLYGADVKDDFEDPKVEKIVDNLGTLKLKLKGVNNERRSDENGS